MSESSASPATDGALTFDQWWKDNSYKFPDADIPRYGHEEVARAAWDVVQNSERASRSSGASCDRVGGGSGCDPMPGGSGCVSVPSETPRMTAKERIAAVRADQAGEPISANQAGMALAQLGRTRLDAMVDRFLSWPLPASVCADGCTTNRDYPHPRSGTNLLTAVEARQMLEHVLSGASAPSAIARRPDEIIADIIKDIRERRGLRQEWDEIDVDVRNEIAATWRGFFK